MKYGDVFYMPALSFRSRSVVKCRFRIDPIPGTGKYHPYKGYLRRIRTTQERRMSFAYPEYTRGKRNFRNLPNSWDDYYRSDINNKSWKHTKKRKQWM